MRLLSDSENPRRPVGVRADPRVRRPGRVRPGRTSAGPTGARSWPTPRCTTPPCSVGRPRRSPWPTRCPTTSPTASNNFYGYNNPEVDALADELNKTSDPARQDEILIEVEKHLFADAFGLPIFQHPSITAYNKTYVKGVSNIAIAPTVFFNVWDWKAAS